MKDQKTKRVTQLHSIPENSPGSKGPQKIIWSNLNGQGSLEKFL